MKSRTYLGPTRERHLHRGHFAFMRAVVQGLPAQEVWDRYLSVEGQGSDARVVRSTIRWIREAFAAAARRKERPGTARLLRLDIQRLVDTTATLPTLEAFAQEQGLEDESQRNQLEAYTERYGAPSLRLSGKARLLKRQLDALHWLEALAARKPTGGDEVAAWLRPELAAALETAGVVRLAQLAERINGIGRNWARAIDRIGPLKARRIADWMAEHAESIGTPIGDHTRLGRRSIKHEALADVVAPASDIRPLEKFIVPAELDGRAGANRLPQQECLLEAVNDYQAILAWLRAKRGPSPAPAVRKQHDGLAADGAIAPADDPLAWLQHLSHTQRSYRKEAERFLLWAIVHRHKALSSMKAEDCTAYRDFLADPQPRGRWCGPRSRERWSPLWRPFEGPLSAAAQRQALTILKNLYAFLVQQNYLRGNPWHSLAVPRSSRPALNTGRSLTRDQWRFVRQQAAAAQGAAALRLRLALDLLYATGLRASEIIHAKVSDLERVEYPEPDGGGIVSGWMLTVVGKGDKRREVPVPADLVDEIGKYLRARGLDLEAHAAAGQGADAALLGATQSKPGGKELAKTESNADATAGIAGATLYRQLKQFFAGCAGQLRAVGDVVGAERVQRASTHWMRHTHASHALASGVKIEVAQQNLGHASIATTTAYVTTERAQRLAAMQGFWRMSSLR